ncbi:MAG: hypothetical protein ACRC6R_07925 [Bacteroidales bacterium]
MKLLILLSIIPVIGFAQGRSNPQQFFDNLKKHQGKAYEGTITSGAREGDDFSGKRLVMHVRSCEDNRIRIPFFVGDDKSRTWVFSLDNDRILLKHDHRHSDGSEDKVTMYGGWTPNAGTPNMQIFPADQYTCDLIEYATFNTWWITIDDTSYTYNLHRLGTSRTFSVRFDLTKPVEVPSAPWGWKE